MVARIKRWFRLILIWIWQRQEKSANDQPTPDHSTPAPEFAEAPTAPAPDSAPLPDPAGDPAPPPVAAPAKILQPPLIDQPKAKWAKPKGLELLVRKPKPEPKPEAAPKPARAPRQPRPRQKAENLEEYGQYYFRDQILDQLDQYFVYIKRLKQRAPDDYELHRRLGIHVVPGQTIQHFDTGRFEGTMDELDAWWKENRPSFGAVAYGIDRGSVDVERVRNVGAPPEEWKEWDKHKDESPDRGKHRIAGIFGSREKIKGMNGAAYRSSAIWVPKFLIFAKYAKTPAHVQRVVDGDVYSLTVYWDRLDHYSKKWQKTHGKKGGVPQEYAVCVEKATGKVRVLKMFLQESVTLRQKRGPDRGQHFIGGCRLNI
jgi:hypothetical protein